MKAIVCSFSGAVTELPRKQRRPLDILNVMKRSPYISTFDMCEYKWLRDGVMALERLQYIERVPNEPYPWHKWKLTEKGLAQCTQPTT